MSSTYVMKISRNGQISIPADVRSRWKAGMVTVVDLGDRVVVRPSPGDPVRELRGKYRGRGPDSETARRAARAADAAVAAGPGLGAGQ